MADKFQLKAIITAVDKLSPVLQKQVKEINKLKRSFASAGSGALPMSAGLAAAVLLPAKAFVEAENAATQLQNTLMTANGGIPAIFKQISDEAITLGNLLPGTTADFMSMAAQLKALGVSSETIAGGALKATAYLGVVGKPMGVTYEQAAEAVGKLGNAFGIAGSDLVPFADSLQRTLHMGVRLDEMQYAMARASGSLKALGKQGLAVADDMVPLVAMLIKSNVSGEEAGTGIKTMINVAVKAGKFTTIPAMVRDLEKLNKLEPSKKFLAFEKLFGKEHAQKAMIIAAGGYQKMIGEMREQASLQQRINNSIGTLGNLWEAATGTFTNAMVAFAESYAPELKKLATSINDLSAKLFDWAKVNGDIIRGVLATAGAFVAFKLAAYAASIALGVLSGVTKMSPLGMLARVLVISAPFIVQNWDSVVIAFKRGAPVIAAAIGVVTLALKLNPMVAFAGLAVGAVGFIISNWDTIGPYFDALVKEIAVAFDWLSNLLPESWKQAFAAVWDALSDWDKLFGYFDALVKSLATVWDSLKNIWGTAWTGLSDMIGGIIDDMIESVLRKIRGLGPLLPNSFLQSSAEALAEIDRRRTIMQGPQSDQEQRRRMLAGARATVTGGIDVNFNNAPAGMRVTPAQTRGPLAITPNVGYRSFATGMP